MAIQKIKLICFLFLSFLLFTLSSSSTNFTVTEGDLVKIKPQARDLDQDEISFSYQPPLNESGEWQTTLNDSGLYQTKVIASDGQSQTEEEVTIIVKNKNQPPQIEEKRIIVEETETVNLAPLISDPDQDPLKLIFPKPFNSDGLWLTSYDDAGTYRFQILASDLEYKTIKTLEIEVKNKNRPPQISSSFSETKLVQLTEDTLFNFTVNASDPDNDSLAYSWQLDEIELSQQPSFSYYFNFNSAGQHQLALTLSDQNEQETKELWVLEIENLNRPPSLEYPDILVNEGEKIILQLPQTDPDQDIVTYTFHSPFQEDGTWQTGYEDAGEYLTNILASDGRLITKKELKITVKDVDRPPQISLDKKIVLNETEELELDLRDFALDPDSDKLSFSVENLPPEASFTGKKIEWRPDYSFVQRKANFFTNFLNRLRLEKFFFPPYQKTSLLITACGKQLCTNHTLEVQVNNVNRPPSLEALPGLTIAENEVLSLSPRASDPDNDYLRYYFDPPFNKKGEWATTYNDQQELFTSITASDGILTDTKTFKITVLNQNRPPTLEIKSDYYKLNEAQSLSFWVGASDPDNNNLTIYAQDLPPGASFQDQLFSWTPSYDTVKERKPTFLNNFYAHSSLLNRRYNKEYQQFTIHFTATDGEFYTVHPVLLTVKNVDRPPHLLDYFPAQQIITTINQPTTFFAAATDPDQENLTYSWSFGLWDRSVTGSNQLKRTFKTPGYKTVKVKATDGTLSAEQEWLVKVAPLPAPAQPLPPSPQPLPSPSQPLPSLPPPVPCEPALQPAQPLPPSQPTSPPALSLTPPSHFKVYVIEG